uniref:Uncharacterized protein n=1 Tax=Rhizophora mucronata TaxID=61149 RepID=A0A2P2PTR8_RHIMU
MEEQNIHLAGSRHKNHWYHHLLVMSSKRQVIAIPVAR